MTQIYNFNGAQLRMIDKDGQPWFLLNDACAVLELAPRVVKQRLAEDVCSTYPLQTSGGVQLATIINEDGLYDVILESRKPEAKAFRKWVTSDVLPSIRKHGMYAKEELLDNPDLLIQVATKLKEERAAKSLLEQRIEADRPKVIFAEALEVSNNSILIGQLAKLLRQNEIEIGQNRLFEWLREEGYLMSKGEQYNMPTQRSMDMELFEIKTSSVNNPDGSVRVTKTTKVTGKGQIYFVNKFVKGA